MKEVKMTFGEITPGTLFRTADTPDVKGCLFLKLARGPSSNQYNVVNAVSWTLNYLGPTTKISSTLEMKFEEAD